MKKLIIPVVVALIAGAYFGIQGYVSSRVKSALDDLAAAAAPIARFTYGDVSTSYEGSITVKDLKLFNAARYIDVRIGRAQLSAGSFIDLLKLEKTFESKRYPEDLTVRLEHVRLPMDLASGASPSNAESALNAYLSKLSVVGCGDMGGMESTLGALGYTRFDLDLGMRLRHDKDRGALLTDLEVAWHDAARVTFHTALEGVRSFGDINPERGPNAFTMEVDSAAYNRRLVAHCAKATNVEEEAFVETHMQLVRQHLEGAGVTLSDGIYQGYRNHLADGAPISVAVEPQDEVGLRYLHMYPPSSYASILGLKVAVGGTPIDLEMSWNQDRLMAVAKREMREPEQALAPPPDVATDVAEPEAAPKKPVGYVTVAPDKLAQHVNAMVRIRTVSGKRFNGQLVRVSKGTAEVKIRMGGGSATLPVRLADIKDSKVFFSNG